MEAEIDATPGFAAMTGVLTAGEHTARLQLLREGRTVEFEQLPLRVHADLASAEEEEEQLAEQENPEAIAFSVEQQWTAGMLAAEVGQRDVSRRVAVAGTFATPPGAEARVSSGFDGRLLAPEGEALPRIGQQVQAGDLLAIVEVPLGVGDLAALRGNSFAWHEHEHELLLREFDLQAQRLHAEQDAELAQTEIDFAQTRMVRMEQLAARELATQRELESARQAVVEAELHRKSALQLLETLAEIGQRLEDLRQEHAEGEIAVQPLRYELRAPISGVIEQALPVAGAAVSAGEELFCIVDPSRLWLSLHVPERHVPALASKTEVHIRLAADPQELLQLTADLNGQRVHTAQQLDPQSRTLAVHYEVDSRQGALRAGMYADAQLGLDLREGVVAIPASAIVQQDGLSVAFVQLDGEHFEKRVLELGVRDGDWVEVLQGLRLGDRVVTRGAYLVRLAGSAPDSFGHGHVH